MKTLMSEENGEGKPLKQMSQENNRSELNHTLQKSANIYHYEYLLHVVRKRLAVNELGDKHAPPSDPSVGMLTQPKAPAQRESQSCQQ